MKFDLCPIFDSLEHFSKLPIGLTMLNEYPDTKLFIENLKPELPSIIDDIIQSQSFLRSYGRKSEATYRSYRNEIERFLLWSWTIAKKTINSLSRQDLERYFDFLNKPPKSWVSSSVHSRFVRISGELKKNEKWRPFALKISKSDRKQQLQTSITPDPSKIAHQLSGEAMKICFSAISSFYDYLTYEGYTFGNPIPAIRKQSPYLLKGATQTAIKRLSKLQWTYVLHCCEIAADKDVKYERMLFLVALLKTLYLRVSELSVRKNWNPIWEHFWIDNDGNQWLKVLGKGNKIRDISVPNALLHYIKRYQNYRISISPRFTSKDPIVSKNRGVGGMSSRQLRNIVQEAFDIAYEKMLSEGHREESKALQSATTHWLRHTGASEDISSRPLKHMADDLGHSSMGTTDQVYIKSDMKERAATGKSRKV